MAARPGHQKYPSYLLFRGPSIKNAAQRRRFDPPADEVRPLDLFEPAMNRCTIPEPRYIRESDRYSVLVFIAGAVAHEDKSSPHAGFCVVFSPSDTGEEGAVVKGKVKTGQEQSASRAELRAAIESLSAYIWWREGFGKVVIVTNSDYVVSGACENISAWKAAGWKDANDAPVANRDLWEILLEKLEEYEGYGVSVQFWLVKSEYNEEAIDGAMQVASVA